MNMDLSAVYDKIYRYCFFKLHHVQTAEDITQEAFLRYFRQNETFGGEKSTAYLYTIAKNLCIDFYRKNRLPDIIEEPIILSHEAETELQLLVKAAVQSLPEELQELILLRYANDLKLGEIAKITGQSRFAVHRRLQAAAELLKNQLKEDL